MRAPRVARPISCRYWSSIHTFVSMAAVNSRRCCSHLPCKCRQSTGQWWNVNGILCDLLQEGIIWCKVSGERRWSDTAAFADLFYAVSPTRTAMWKSERAPSCCNWMPLGSSSIKMGKRNSPYVSRYTTPVTVHLANGKARTLLLWYNAKGYWTLDCPLYLQPLHAGSSSSRF